MFGSTILEVAIGLLFVYLLFSVMCSAIQEWISRLLDWRARDLEKYIKTLLQDPELTRKLYAHPMVKQLTRKTGLDKVLTKTIPKVNREGKPSYISSGSFATALTDILEKIGKKENNENPMENIEKGIQKVFASSTGDGSDKEFSHPLESFLQSVKLDAENTLKSLEKLRGSIENWFNDSMHRASDWYRQKARVMIFVVAALLTFSLNVDSLMIAKRLYEDQSLRATVVAAAEQEVQGKKDGQATAASTTSPVQEIKTLKNRLKELQMPLGWHYKAGIDEDPLGLPGDWQQWLYKILGLLLTALAISMGAPFWMDLVKQLLKRRK